MKGYKRTESTMATGKATKGQINTMTKGKATKGQTVQ
jgi:hypothetical protein